MSILTRISLVLIVTLSTIFKSYAHTSQYSSFLRKGSIVSNATLTTKSQNSANGYTIYRIQPRLVYGREAQSDVAGATGWAYEVKYLLRDVASNSVLADNQSLKIGTDGVVKYEAMNVYNGAQEVRLEIKNVVPTGTVPTDIRLELNLEVEQYDGESGVPPTVEHELKQNETEHILQVRWEPKTGAESYEIEWLFIDNKSPDATLSPALIRDEHFQQAVRTEVTNTYYDINLTYPSGRIFYRVRAVGRFIPDGSTVLDVSHNKYGAWRMPTSAVVITGFEDNRNWQFVSTYAEEGKYKKVISYYDDGLKKREVLTHLSTEGITLAGKTFYDNEGRGTVQVLPAPVYEIGSGGIYQANNNLFYKPILANYTPNRFDKLVGNAEPPKDNSAGVPTVNDGAAFYFSPQNTTNTLYRQYTADAGGYPMTQTRFMQDGTGRVVAQSGVGSTYQLGSGKETMYFYTTPAQMEISRLFGTNVGDKSFYKKNLVRDANGQYSVSYLDMMGKVIATALTGASPSNVTPLSSEASGSYTVFDNLMVNNATNLNKGESVAMSNVMHIGVPRDYTFTYAINGKAIIAATGSSTGGPCLGCKYELSFKVEDPMGKSLCLNGAPATTILDYNTLCNTPSSAETKITFKVKLGCAEPQNCDILIDKLPIDAAAARTATPQPIGTAACTPVEGVYKIYKILRVIEPSWAEWEAKFASGGFKTKSEYLGTYANTTEELDCYYDCERYWTERYKSVVSPTMTLKEYLKINCDDVANNVINGSDDEGNNASQAECYSLAKQMAAQLMPGGYIFEQKEDANILIRWSNYVPIPFTLAINQTQTRTFSSKEEFKIYLEANPDVRNNKDFIIALAMLHPEKCHYLWCKDLSNNKQSFDLPLSLTTQWTQNSAAQNVQDKFSLVSVPFTVAGVFQLLSKDMSSMPSGFRVKYEEDMRNNIASPVLPVFPPDQLTKINSIYDALKMAIDLTEKEKTSKGFANANDEEAYKLEAFKSFYLGLKKRDRKSVV